MQRIANPSSAITRYADIGGVVEFAVYDDADGDPDAVFAAVCDAAPIENPEALRAIGFRRLDDASFYGDWYELATHSLLLIGTWGGIERPLVNPKLRDLDDHRLAGGGLIPEAGAGGQFAYAFSHPPYGLQAKPREIQDLFDKIRHAILPAAVDHEILDWSSPDLPMASSYFEPGMEWWGVFLFSIYVPEHRRLSIVWASTTD
ncbi:MAG: hypothetical protein AB7O98_00775 [Hyphomonadaceae bacterium]